MSDMKCSMKCPICGEPLQKFGEIDPDAGTSICMGANCPKCGIGNSDIKLWQAFIQAKQDLENARKAIDVANKAIECSERFLLGVQDKKIEMAKATRSSHLLLFQLPAMAALCLNTVRDYKDKIKTITEHKEPVTVHNKIEFPEHNDGLLEEFDKQFFENGQDDDLTETALGQKDV